MISCIFINILFTFCPTYPVEIVKPFDIKKLSYAVAKQETGGCTTGVGASRNNCFGLRKNGEFMYFNTKAESYAYFENMWQNSRYYHGFPTLEMAKKYVGESDAKHWLANVTKFYNS